LRGQAAEAESKSKALIEMSSEDGETGDGGGGTPTAEAIMDSTVKILVSQLSEKIEQQVSRAIKAAMEATSMAG
jgi:hypothetical protein